jgi:hypothetical protein
VPKFEYRVVTILLPGGPGVYEANAEAVMNTLGNLKWELVAVALLSNLEAGLFFKRPK